MVIFIVNSPHSLLSSHLLLPPPPPLTIFSTYSTGDRAANQELHPYANGQVPCFRLKAKTFSHF